MSVNRKQWQGIRLAAKAEQNGFVTAKLQEEIGAMHNRPPFRKNGH